MLCHKTAYEVPAVGINNDKVVCYALALFQSLFSCTSFVENLTNVLKSEEYKNHMNGSLFDVEYHNDYKGGYEIADDLLAIHYIMGTATPKQINDIVKRIVDRLHKIKPDRLTGLGKYNDIICLQEALCIALPPAISKPLRIMECSYMRDDLPPTYYLKAASDTKYDKKHPLKQWFWKVVMNNHPNIKTIGEIISIQIASDMKFPKTLDFLLSDFSIARYEIMAEVLYRPSHYVLRCKRADSIVLIDTENIKKNKAAGKFGDTYDDGGGKYSTYVVYYQLVLIENYPIGMSVIDILNQQSEYIKDNETTGYRYDV